MKESNEKPRTSVSEVPSTALLAEDEYVDWTETPEYAAHCEELAKYCKCRYKPCDGCLAGAPCDADMYGDGREGWDLYCSEDDEFFGEQGPTGTYMD